MARPRGRALEKQRIQAAAQKASAATAASRRKAILWGAAGVLVVGALVAYVLTRPPAPGEVYPSLGNDHLAAPTDPHASYNSHPPSSGPHVGFLAEWGESRETVPPEVFVHNLEDGGVVLAYDCPEGCEDLVAGMRDVLDSDRMLMTPYAGIQDSAGVAHRAAAVAWTRVFYFDQLDETARSELERFIRLFRGIDHHVR